MYGVWSMFVILDSLVYSEWLLCESISMLDDSGNEQRRARQQIAMSIVDNGSVEAVEVETF
jgi:hypothetical protein